MGALTLASSQATQAADEGGAGSGWDGDAKRVPGLTGRIHPAKWSRLPPSYPVPISSHPIPSFCAPFNRWVKGMGCSSWGIVEVGRIGLANRLQCALGLCSRAGVAQISNVALVRTTIRGLDVFVNGVLFLLVSSSREN